MEKRKTWLKKILMRRSDLGMAIFFFWNCCLPCAVLERCYCQQYVVFSLVSLRTGTEDVAFSMKCKGLLGFWTLIFLLVLCATCLERALLLILDGSVTIYLCLGRFLRGCEGFEEREGSGYRGFCHFRLGQGWPGLYIYAIHFVIVNRPGWFCFDFVFLHSKKAQV